MAKKVFIRTYGCQMNEYDSARMLDALREGQAMESTDRPEDADLILLNTCSIREKAQEKVFSELGRYRSLKADKPDLEARQRQGRELLWDKAVDRQAWEGFKAARVPQKPYVYQTGNGQ